ncbi:NADH:flavin oxidoreductase/NADH oxidase [Colletotrichum asianum]
MPTTSHKSIFSSCTISTFIHLITSSSVAVASQRSSEEEPEYLPYPATKLIIGQYYVCSRDPPHWGWLIVGTFYDPDNNPVWSTEIFAFQRDTRGDQTHSQSVSSSDSGSSAEQELTARFSNSLRFNTSASTHNHRLWDPTLAGPVPGHWVTQYDPRINNWVNTWQPHHHPF